MSLYELIETSFVSALKNGALPNRLHLTSEGLEQLINDRTLSASWSPRIESFWDQKVLGLPLIQAASNAIEIDGKLHAL